MNKNYNFLDLDEQYSDFENSKISILPVPYDKTSTWIKGADKGPLAVISASSALELYDIETETEVYKKGIYTCRPVISSSAPEEMVEEVRGAVDGLLKAKKYVVTLGGEHSVSIGSIAAHKDFYEDLSVLQLDAHADFREEYEGSRYNHACVSARAGELCPVTQVGIRSMSLEEKERSTSGKIFFAKDIVNTPGWEEKAAAGLSGNVYVTIDLDVFDPSIMPSTGTPEPGGLLWYDVINFLKIVSKEKNVVGFDVVELCPNETNKGPDFMAAKLIYKFLNYIHK